MTSESGYHPDMAIDQPEQVDQPSTAYRPLGDVDGFGTKTVVNPERRGSDHGSSRTPTPSKTASSLVGKLFANDADSQAEVPNPEGLELLHFRIEEQIGSGGMGSVFRAVDTQLNRIVALKVLSPRFSNDTSAIKRFKNESRSAAALDHENIATVYFYGEDHGLHFIAFEFIEGINIRELINRKGPLEPLEALSYTLQISTALHHTAMKGVYHRDIKPSNIIVKENKRATLVDWGLARSVKTPDQSADLTVAGTTLGTFDYISPEQARDPRNVDARSDIYSLGCTFYHMLTGEPPYGEGTVLQKLLDHQNKVVPNPSHKNPAVSREMSDVVVKMMASNPAQRYQTVDELMHDLTLLAGHLGLHGVPSESLVWTNSFYTPPRQSFWEGNIGWIAMVVVLVVSAFVVEQLNSPTPDFQADSGGQSFNNNGNSLDLGINSGGQAGSVNNEGAVSNVLALSENLFQSDGSQGTNIEVGTMLSPWMKGDGTGSEDAELVSVGDGPPGKTDNTMAAQPDGNGTTPASTTNGMGQPTKSTVETTPKAFELFRRGITVGSFETLEAAISAATDQATIKVYPSRTGETIQVKRPVLIRSKHITIRAESGFTPTIQFASMAGTASPTVLRLEESSLDLVNLNLNIAVEPSFQHDHQSFIELADAERLTLKNSNITVDNQSVLDFALVSIVGNDDYPTMKKMMKSRAQDSLQIVADSTIVRGRCDVVALRSAKPGKLNIRQSAFAIDGVMIRNVGEPTFANEEGAFDVEIENVTAFLQQGFLQTDVGKQPNSSTTINVKSDKSIYSIGNGMPFVSMTGNILPSDFILMFYWEGNQNFFENSETMLTIDGSRDEVALPDFDALSTWGQHWNTAPHGEKIIWTKAERPADWQAWTPDDFELDAKAETNPAYVLEVGANPYLLPNIAEDSAADFPDAVKDSAPASIIDSTPSS